MSDESNLTPLLYFGLLFLFCLFMIKALNAAIFAWSLHDFTNEGFWFWWLKKFKGEI